MTTERGSTRGGLAKRLAWFVGLWAAGVVTVGGVAFLLRLLLKP